MTSTSLSRSRSAHEGDAKTTKGNISAKNNAFFIATSVLMPHGHRLPKYKGVDDHKKDRQARHGYERPKGLVPIVFHGYPVTRIKGKDIHNKEDGHLEPEYGF